MNTPSEEQQKIVDSIINGQNVIVDACAGSGKSTTIFACASAMPQCQFILFTFNKVLQTETEEKAKVLALSNINVFTYHGMAVKFYSNECHNDTGIRHVLRDKTEPRVKIPEYDIVVLDETQDMTKVYYDLVWKFLLDMGKQIQLLILGDEKQALYGFKGADSRFLTMADMIWTSFPNLKTKEFIQHMLYMSYRITDPMGKFLNKVMLNQDRVLTCKSGEPVNYIRRPLYNNKDFSALKVLKCMIMNLLNNGVKYDDIFVLGRSVKSNNRIVRMLENVLVKNGIPCYIPNTDNKDELDTRVIQNKLVFSTFHAAKGRQRPYVFIVGFDDSHFMFKDKDTESCPNELYVACTRATVKMFVWENIEQRVGPLPFLNYNHNQMQQSDFIKFNGIPSGKRPIVVEENETKVKKRYVEPSDIVKFISEQTLDIISPIVDDIFITIQEPMGELIDIPTVHKTSSGNYEDVSDLNGNVLPLMYFDHLRGSYEPVLQNLIRYYMKEVLSDEHQMLQDAMEKMPEICTCNSDYLYLANLLSATQNKLYSRFKQIPYEEYNWMTDDVVSQCFENLDNVLREECNRGNWKPEQTIIHISEDPEHISIDTCLNEHFEDDYTIFRFSARADIVTQQSLWELKCTNQLTIEHKLQIIMYAWLFQMKCSNEKKEKDFYLFNIKSNELLKLNATIEQLTTIVVAILKNKYYKLPELSDVEFLEQFLED